MSTKKATTRYYEIDAIRSIALILLIFYHIFAAYQPNASEAKLIGYEKTLTDYQFVSEIFSVWRTPLLFLISGVAIGFLLNRRTALELLGERLMRLVPPLVFCSFFVTPLVPGLYNLYYGEPIVYFVSPWHLWFVKNLVIYVIIFLPIIAYFKEYPENIIVQFLRRSLPWVIAPMLATPFLIETVITAPTDFGYYPPRFWYGFSCFAAGFIFFRIGPAFWAACRQQRHPTLAAAFILYLLRLYLMEQGLFQATLWTAPIESACWMLAVLGYGSQFFNRPIPVVAYLNGVVFPVYIIHMVVLQVVAFVIYNWGLAAELTYLLHCTLTIAGSLLFYEAVIRPNPWLHPFFGVNLRNKPQPAIRSHGAEARSHIGRVLTYYILTPIVLVASIT